MIGSLLPPGYVRSDTASCVKSSCNYQIFMLGVTVSIMIGAQDGLGMMDSGK